MIRLRLWAGWVVLALALNVVGAAEGRWLTSLPQAMKEASGGHRLILLDFTGSDWCYACKVLKGEVFNQKVFLDYAEKHLVLVEVDFPMRKKQAAELKKSNEALKERYGVKEYPTLLLVNARGEKVGELDFNLEAPEMVEAIRAVVKQANTGG